MESWLLERHDGLDVGWLVGCAKRPVGDLLEDLPEGQFDCVKLGHPNRLRL